jgi:hypothetical protein
MVLSAVPAGWPCGPQPQPVTRFAALGDSVTVGLGDPMPQGGWRGWAALLAGLATSYAEVLRALHAAPR